MSLGPVILSEAKNLYSGKGYCASYSGSIPLLASKEDPTAATTARLRPSAANSRIR